MTEINSVNKINIKNNIKNFIIFLEEMQTNDTFHNLVYNIKDSEFIKFINMLNYDK